MRNGCVVVTTGVPVVAVVLCTVVVVVPVTVTPPAVPVCAGVAMLVNPVLLLGVQLAGLSPKLAQPPA